MASPQRVQSLATLLLGGLQSLQLSTDASGRLLEAATQLTKDLQELSTSQEALRQVASSCRHLVAACAKLEDRLQKKLRRGPPAATDAARAWAAALLQHTSAACMAMEGVADGFYSPNNGRLLEPGPTAPAVAALMRCGAQALGAFCRWGLGQPDRPAEASAAGTYLAHGMVAQLYAVTRVVLAAGSDPSWRAAASSNVLAPVALRAWLARVAEAGHVCLAVADPTSANVHNLLAHSLPLFLSVVALHGRQLADQMDTILHDDATMRRLGRLLAASHALLLDNAQPCDGLWNDRHRSVCLFVVGLSGQLGMQAPLLGAALPMLGPAMQLLARLPMVPPSEAPLGSYCHTLHLTVWLVSALADFRLSLLHPNAQADMQHWSADAQAAVAEAAGGGSEAAQQALSDWLAVLPAAARFFEALVPGQPPAANVVAGMASLGAYVLCLLRFGAACKAASAWGTMMSEALFSACTADVPGQLQAAAAAEALLRLAPKLPGLLPYIEAAQHEGPLDSIAVVMRQTLALAFHVLVALSRQVSGRLPTPVEQALRYAHANACKVPHALAQLPRQQLAAAGLLYGSSGDTAGNAPLRLAPNLLTQVASCLSFSKDILEGVYAEALDAEEGGAVDSARHLLGMALRAGPALMACAAMLPPGVSGGGPVDSLELIVDTLGDALACLPSLEACMAVLLVWRQQAGQLAAAGLAVPPAVAALLDHAEAVLLEQGISTADGSPPAELEQALGQLHCANLCCPNVAGCSEGEQQGKRCARCGMVRYCGPACQRADWKRHKPVCQPA